MTENPAMGDTTKAEAWEAAEPPRFAGKGALGLTQQEVETELAEGGGP